MNKFIIIMGPTGSGKTTVLSESGVLSEPGIQYVQSYTTRDLRPGEVNGEKYHHITDEQFASMIAEEQFLEYASFSFCNYGTALKSITEPMANGDSPLKEMEMQGYLSFCRHDQGIPHVSIFLAIDDATIIQRVTERGSMEQSQLEDRVSRAGYERELASEHCHHIIDASQPLEGVVADFLDVLKTEGLLK